MKTRTLILLAALVPALAGCFGAGSLSQKPRALMMSTTDCGAYSSFGICRSAGFGSARPAGLVSAEARR